MAGNTTVAGETVTRRALSLMAAFDEDHRRLGLTDWRDAPAFPSPPPTGWSPNWSTSGRWSAPRSATTSSAD